MTTPPELARLAAADPAVDRPIGDTPAQRAQREQIMADPVRSTRRSAGQRRRLRLAGGAVGAVALTGVVGVMMVSLVGDRPPAVAPLAQVSLIHQPPDSADRLPAVPQDRISIDPSNLVIHTARLVDRIGDERYHLVAAVDGRWCLVVSTLTPGHLAPAPSEGACATPAQFAHRGLLSQQGRSRTVPTSRPTAANRPVVVVVPDGITTVQDPILGDGGRPRMAPVGVRGNGARLRGGELPGAEVALSGPAVAALTHHRRLDMPAPPGARAVPSVIEPSDPDRVIVPLLADNGPATVLAALRGPELSPRALPGRIRARMGQSCGMSSGWSADQHGPVPLGRAPGVRFFVLSARPAGTDTTRICLVATNERAAAVLGVNDDWLANIRRRGVLVLPVNNGHHQATAVLAVDGVTRVAFGGLNTPISRGRAITTTWASPGGRDLHLGGPGVATLDLPQRAERSDDRLGATLAPADPPDGLGVLRREATPRDLEVSTSRGGSMGVAPSGSSPPGAHDIRPVWEGARYLGSRRGVTFHLVPAQANGGAPEGSVCIFARRPAASVVGSYACTTISGIGARGFLHLVWAPIIAAVPSTKGRTTTAIVAVDGIESVRAAGQTLRVRNNVALGDTVGHIAPGLELRGPAAATIAASSGWALRGDRVTVPADDALFPNLDPTVNPRR